MKNFASAANGSGVSVSASRLNVGHWNGKNKQGNTKILNS